MNIERENILGVNISAVNLEQTLEIIGSWINTQSQNYVCVTPAHSIMECYHRPEFRNIFNASGLTTPDGMSIVWLLKLLGNPHVSRVYGPDLMLEIFKHSIERGWKHYLYGGAPQVAEKLATTMQQRFHGLRITGIYCPPFRPLTSGEDKFVIDQINYSQADIVWVGISTPNQECWMADHLGIVNAPVMIGVGAAFDFLSGVKPQAPRWVQRIGFEWLFRLFTEPRRLWRRYAQYPLFGVLVALQILGIKKIPPN
jgi:N-acetylglucosaminyldiphosphoundecaprenol N-acetyl-beta-D-mannosaminyltransferase